MNIELTEIADPKIAASIREANDRFRQSLTGGAVTMTAGIVALGAETQHRIFEAIRAFDDFDPDEPWDAHDLGDLEIEVESPGTGNTRLLIFFRIDRHGNDRALTLMLASEW